MKKIIKLTESDLVRIVERVIKEQEGETLIGQTFNIIFDDLGKLSLIVGREDIKDFKIISSTKKGPNVTEMIVGIPKVYEIKLDIRKNNVMVVDQKLIKRPDAIVLCNKQYGSQNFEPNIFPRVKKSLPNMEIFKKVQETM
jgi:hypothetical protein